MRHAMSWLLLLVPSTSLLAQASSDPVLLQGRVVDMRGSGVPAARVQVTSWGESEPILARGTSDGDGYFRIGRVPWRSAWSVSATADGQNAVDYYWHDASEPVSLRLFDAAVLTGVLRNKMGEPVPRVVLRAISWNRVSAAHDLATTDDAGMFRLSKVTPGPVSVVAAVPGEGLYEKNFRARSDAEIALAPNPGGRTSLTIRVDRLPPDLLVSVRVVLQPNGGFNGLPPPWYQPALSADATCVLTDVPDVPYTVRLQAPDFAFVPVEITAKGGYGPHQMRFEALARERPLVQCQAVLRDTRDAPLSGVRLALRAKQGDSRAEATSSAEGSLLFTSREAVGSAVIVESLDDRWVLDQTKEGRMTGAGNLAYLPWHECTVAAEPPFDLQAVRASTATGRLLLPDGEPARFVVVQLEAKWPRNRPQWSPFARATTDRLGIYHFARLHHINAALRVTVRGPAGAADGEPFDLDVAGSARELLDLQLAAPAVIEGVVRHANGEPEPGVRVWLRDWDLTIKHQHSGSLIECITDQCGRYYFFGVPPGGAWLQLLVLEPGTSGRAVEPFAVEAGKTYAVDLRMPAQ
ncbi:MAG: carboxypeptidase-like regulatory domain-containing protein [Planctomycetota bacterium]